MIFAEYNTINEYEEANDYCHNKLKGVDGYNSPMYASETPIESVKGTYLLPLVEKFKNYLDLDWKEINDSYIKKVEL